jgi:hypothetical protein
MSTPLSGATVTTNPGTRPSNRRGKAPAAGGSGHARSSTTSRTEGESYSLVPRLPLAQRSIMVGKVASLEGRLFDGEGHVRRGLSDEMAGTLLKEINDLRDDLGWLSLDLHHHQMWPPHPSAERAPMAD